METIDVTIETPKGSSVKYVYDKELNAIRIKKLMPTGMVFPFDFGYIPGTLGGDGDPLDVLVYSEGQSFPGCIIECRIVGVLIANQTDVGGPMVRNDRFIAVPVWSVTYDYLRTIKDMPRVELDKLERFFINYNEAQGKKFEIIKRNGAEAAYKQIMQQLSKR